jgi:hypothetical protein
MSETRTYSRAELLTMATGFHGGVFSKEQFEAMSDRKLESLCHPMDVDRKGIGW